MLVEQQQELQLAIWHFSLCGGMMRRDCRIIPCYLWTQSQASVEVTLQNRCKLHMLGCLLLIVQC
uniref:Uncharacterized protein n=1 Tax=Arundo donax TaxID=35708 RepID=A0A0A9CFU5_ARUDO